MCGEARREQVHFAGPEALKTMKDLWMQTPVVVVDCIEARKIVGQCILMSRKMNGLKVDVVGEGERLEALGDVQHAPRTSSALIVDVCESWRVVRPDRHGVVAKARQE